MIQGVGIDIEDIHRIQKLSQHPAFLKKIFTGREIKHCQKFENAHERFAVRFAAKEAFFKASPDKKISWHDVEIQNKKDGSPYYVIHDSFIAKKYKTYLSLSHTEDKAIAICVLTAPENC